MREGIGWRWLGAAWLVLACLFAVPALAEGGAEITQLQLERSEEGLLLSATVQFELPAVIDDALAKGIPMYFVAEASVSRDRWYWYDRRLAGATRHMRLSYQPLTRRWRLQASASPIGNSGLVLGQMFESRDEALAALQRISRWRISDPGEVEADASHSVQLRFRLDLSQLPRPFQIGAVGQSEWSIQATRTQRLPADGAR